MFNLRGKANTASITEANLEAIRSVGGSLAAVGSLQFTLAFVTTLIAMQLNFISSVHGVATKILVELAMVWKGKEKWPQHGTRISESERRNIYV